MNGNNWRGRSWDCDDEDDRDNREDKLQLKSDEWIFAIMMMILI